MNDLIHHHHRKEIDMTTDIKPSPAELAKAIQDRHMERVRSITSKYAAPNLTESQIRQRDDELRESTNQAARELQFLGRP